MIVMIDGPMLCRFIDNSEAFNNCANERFDLIEQNRRDQKVKFAESTALDREDCRDKQHQAVDREKFRAELKEALAAAAAGFGTTPVNVVVDAGSFMMKVHEAEITRIEKEKEEQKKMKSKVETGNGNHERKCSQEYLVERECEEIVGSKKMNKRRSMKFLSFCACSGQFNADENS